MSKTSPDVEHELIVYEMAGLDRLSAIQQALKDKKLRRQPDGTLQIAKPDERPSLLAI